MSEGKAPRRRRLAAVAAAVWLAVAGVARAEPGALALVAEGYDDESAERLRATLERELGRPVERREAAAGGEAIVVSRRGAGREVKVAYAAPGGQRLERGLRVQDDPDRAEGEVALLASNLARDESAALIAGLPAEKPAAPAAAKAPAKPEFSCKRRKAPEVALGADFVPFVGLSTLPAGRAAARTVSLNVLGGLSRGTGAFEGAGVFNLDTEFVCGVQVAGAVNYAGGPVRGVQGAGAVNVALGPIEGVQGAGALNVALGSVEGLQGAGAVNFAGGGFEGVQGAGAVNVALGVFRGVQGAGAVNVAGLPAPEKPAGDAKGRRAGEAAGKGGAAAGGPWAFEGVQGAGAVNVSLGPLRGAQASGAVSFTKGAVEGVQVAGGLNLALGPVRGAQLGPFNAATGRVRGVQIGVINYAEDADFALGFINIFPKGRTHLDAWFVPEVGMVSAALKHGGAHFHYFYGLGARIADQTPWYVWGLGGHITPGGAWFVDVDALSYGRVGIKAFERNEGRGINQLRVVVGHPVATGLALYAGPSGNVSLAGREHGPPMYSFYERKASPSDPDSLAIYVWPGLVLGLQAL